MGQVTKFPDVYGFGWVELGPLIKISLKFKICIYYIRAAFTA